MLRIVVLFSVLSEAIRAVASGSLAVSELALFSSLSHQLVSGDILLGDRGFGCYPLIAWVKLSLGVDFIGRTTRPVKRPAPLPLSPQRLADPLETQCPPLSLAQRPPMGRR